MSTHQEEPEAARAAGLRSPCGAQSSHSGRTASGEQTSSAPYTPAGTSTKLPCCDSGPSHHHQLPTQLQCRCPQLWRLCGGAGDHMQLAVVGWACRWGPAKGWGRQAGGGRQAAAEGQVDEECAESDRTSGEARVTTELRLISGGERVMAGPTARPNPGSSPRPGCPAFHRLPRTAWPSPRRPCSAVWVSLALVLPPSAEQPL